MIKNAKTFIVNFKNGLHNPVKVEAENVADAAVEGMIAFRKDIYFPDFRRVEEVVDNVVEA